MGAHFEIGIPQSCDCTEWVVEEVRHHYGERTALHLAFSAHASKTLEGVLYVGLGITLCLQWSDWGNYASARCLWAPGPVPLGPLGD